MQINSVYEKKCLWNTIWISLCQFESSKVHQNSFKVLVDEYSSKINVLSLMTDHTEI